MLGCRIILQFFIVAGGQRGYLIQKENHVRVQRIIVTYYWGPLRNAVLVVKCDSG